MTMTVIDSGTDIPHIIYDASIVPSACSGSIRCSATLAPAPDATTDAEIGSSCAAVILSNACLLDAEISSTVSEMVTATATAASSIQHTHANVTAQGPQYGMHSEHHAEISVEKPIGTVPRKSELALSAIMTGQISGYAMYRNTEMARAQEKRRALSPKKRTESQ